MILQSLEVVKLLEYLDSIFNEDCLSGMNKIPDKSIDLILSDLPYGITNCKWDSILDFNLLWAQYWRVLKDNGAVVLTAVQPFTTDVINSCQRYFRYCWYWNKNQPTGFTFAKYQPMRCIEDVCVFYKKAPTYNPQGLILLDKPIKVKGKKDIDGIYKTDSLGKETVRYVTNYPRNLLKINCERGLHPTQKPVPLFEYLIRTYTNEGETVLDSCAGSCTTAVACINTGRHYVCFETDLKIYETAVKRVDGIKKKCSTS